MEYRNCIFNIRASGVRVGVGFVIGDFFVTAGHVVKDNSNPWININECNYYLKDENALFIDDNHKSDKGYDFAIFKIEGVNSRLVFEDGF